MIHEPVKKKKKFILFLLILPVLALIISAGIMYKHFAQLEEEITITFNNAEGFIVNKTPLKYKGIKVGVVSDIAIEETDINKFLVKVRLTNQSTNVIAREGSVFWKVEPKVSINEISGLNTLISGNYIEVRPYNNDVAKVLKQKKQTFFKSLESQPFNAFENEGLLLTLTSQKGNLSIGAPVLYKSFVVGKIQNKKLKGTTVYYTLFIDTQYKDLIKTSSQFWRASGIEVKASLSGLKMDVENFETLLAGGIAFSSKEDSKILEDYSEPFTLYNSQEEVQFSQKRILLKSSNAYNLDEEFSKIYYNGFEVGKVDEIQFNQEEKLHYIFLKLKKSSSDLLNYTPHFQIIQPKIGLDKIEGVSALVKSNYIKLSVNTKQKKELKSSYKLHENPKKINMYSMTLYTSKNTKISRNSPVYYKNIKVGYVSSYYLNKKQNQVKVKLNIYWIYRDLINDSSLFYEQAPIEFKADLKGVLVKTAPIKSFIHSGISFFTTHLNEKHSKKSFELFSTEHEARTQEYLHNKGKIYQLRVRTNADVKEGEDIYYKGLEIGRVLKSHYSEKNDEIYFKIFILDKFTNLLNESTRFYSLSSIDVDMSLDKLNIKTKSFYSMLNGGIAFYTANKEAKSVNKLHLFEFDQTLEEAEQKFVYATIELSRGYDLRAGSKVLYKDIPIGTVSTIRFKNSGKLEASIQIDKIHEALLNTDTLFYLDNFEFSLNKIKNPRAALFGSNIQVIAGSSNVRTTKFQLIPHKPFKAFNKNGLRVIVNTNLKSSLKENSPIYYRQLQIGVVEGFSLSSDSTKVRLELFIDQKYAHLVRKNSIFYNASAFGVDLSLFGVKIRTETLETLVSGGISMVTPTNYLEQASMNEEYELHEDLDDDWLEWKPKIKR